MSLADWANVGVIIQSAVVVVAAVIALGQLTQGNRTRSLGLLQAIFRDVHSPEAYELRVRITSGNASAADKRTLTDFFQRIGFLVQHRFISADLVLLMYSSMIQTNWDALRSYVMEVRQDGPANYAADFEHLARRAGDFRRRRFPSPQDSPPQ